MTTRTVSRLVCACGHEGRISMSENDAPFSRQYESYSVTGFDCLSNTFSVVDRFATWDEVFSETKPVCPVCKNSITENNIKGDIK